MLTRGGTVMRVPIYLHTGKFPGFEKMEGLPGRTT
jgi:hypothetical protein